MKAEKANVKTRLRVNERYDLCHQIIINNIKLSELERKGSNYHISVYRKGEKGHLLFNLLVNKEKLDKKKTFKISYITVSKSDGYIQISSKRTISHKSIKLQKGQYHLEYEQNAVLKVFYTIPQNYFEKKYLPVINDMLRKRKLKSTSIRNISKKSTKKINASQKNTQRKYEDKKKKVLRDNGSTVRDARTNSFRMCENCDYYSSREEQCGLFYREVKPYNICSRFNYTRFRIYSGGGFSPR